MNDDEVDEEVVEMFQRAHGIVLRCLESIDPRELTPPFALAVGAEMIKQGVLLMVKSRGVPQTIEGIQRLLVDLKAMQSKKQELS